MNFKNIKPLVLGSSLVAGAFLTSCYEKFDPTSYAPDLSIGGYTQTTEISPANLVAYWSFDESIVDQVSKTTGESKGTTFVNGIKKNALQAGIDKYAVTEASQSVKSLKSFTITQWVNSPQNTDGIVGIFDLSNTKGFWGNLTIFFENGSTETDAILKMHVNNGTKDIFLGNYTIKNMWNKWTNIGLTYDAPTSTFKVFVNGTKIATKVEKDFGEIKFTDAGKIVFGTVQFQTTPSLNGGDKQPWASFLKGQLDEVRIYNVALKEADVDALVKLEGRGK